MFTTLRPFASGTERATTSSESGRPADDFRSDDGEEEDGQPDEPGDAEPDVAAPGRRLPLEPLGNRRSTRTNTTVVRVSTTTWVWAESGAP